LPSDKEKKTKSWFLAFHKTRYWDDELVFSVILVFGNVLSKFEIWVFLDLSFFLFA